MNKKLWKRVTAFAITCTLVIGTAGVNTALAAGNAGGDNCYGAIEKVNSKPAKEETATKNMGTEENTSELNRILEECKPIEADSSSREIRKGQMMSGVGVANIAGTRDTRRAIMQNGDLYCWGYNKYGQVGNGTTENQLTPIKVLSDVKSVSYPSSFYYPDFNSTVSAITGNGDLYCWGNNRYGQVGNGTTKNQLTPVKVLSNVKSVSYSYSTVLAITRNGDLYCWGNNGHGQVGNGTIWDQLTPIKVLSNVKSITYSLSYSHSSSYFYSNSTMSAIMENGDLYCWGFNDSGQVGSGTTENQLTPVKVLSDVKSVSYSSFYSSSSASSYSQSNSTVLAIMGNGDLYCWGSNPSGQVGSGTGENQLTPIKVLSDVKSVSYSHPDSNSTMSAITRNGDLYCWGFNDSGQVGNGTIENQLTPIKVLSNVKSVSYSESDSYSYHYSTVSAIIENGDLYCWGFNRDGQIGNGTTENQLTPVKVLSDVKSVFSSYSRSYHYSYSTVSAIIGNGDLYCWGFNGYYQVGNGTTENQLTPIKVLSDVKSVSYSNSAVSAIMGNDDLYCWGFNEYGQIGNGTTEDQLTPIKVLSDVKSVSYSYPSSSSYSYFYPTVSVITGNSDLYCWGFNEYGQVGNGNIEDQLTPTLILGSSLNPGLSKDGCLQISNSLTVEKGKEIYIIGKIFADNLDKLKEISKSLVWSSANPSVATAEYMGSIFPTDANSKSMLVDAKITGISRGETDIFVSAPDGSKVCCHVIVSKPTGTAEETESGYSYCFNIAGELQEVNSANQSIKIDGINYEVSSDSTMDNAKKIFEQSDNKIVACSVRAKDHKIVRIDDVKDIIGKPSVRIEPEVDNIDYENGKFSKTKFKINLEMYCSVKEPYTVSDISDAIKKVDGLEVDFSKVSLDTSYDNQGEPFVLRDGLEQGISLEKKLNFKLKPGRTKNISVTAYVKDSLSVKKVNADAVIKATVNDDIKTKTTGVVHISNLDKAREQESKKLANSSKTPELQNVNTILNGSQVAFTLPALKKCLTDTEVKAICAQVNNWVYTSNALNSIINDDSGVIKKLLTKYGLTKEGIQNKILKKLGIDKKVISIVRPYQGTLQFEAKDKNTGKKITIKFTLDMSFYEFGDSNSSYAGTGELRYKISSGGSGSGPVTFTNYDSFVASLKKVVESQIHNCFNLFGFNSPQLCCVTN